MATKLTVTYAFDKLHKLWSASVLQPVKGVHILASDDTLKDVRRRVKQEICKVLGVRSLPNNMVITHLEPKDVPEEVNHPGHYGGDTTYEAIKVIEAWGLGFCDGNAVKYIRRWKDKGGLQDLEKALWYLQRFIAQERDKAARVARAAASIEPLPSTINLPFPDAPKMPTKASKRKPTKRQR